MMGQIHKGGTKKSTVKKVSLSSAIPTALYWKQPGSKDSPKSDKSAIKDQIDRTVYGGRKELLGINTRWSRKGKKEVENNFRKK